MGWRDGIARKCVVCALGMAIAATGSARHAVSANGAAKLAPRLAINLLTISCDGFTTAKAWCEAAQAQLPEMTQLDTRLMMTLKIPTPFLDKARHLARTAPKRVLQGKGSATRLADLGLAQILTDQTAEGVQSLLASAVRRPTTGALDWAFVGFAALYPELSTMQQREWSADFASRLMRLSLDRAKASPRAVDVARVTQLFRLAGDAERSALFAQRLQTMPAATSAVPERPPLLVAREALAPRAAARPAQARTRDSFEPRGGYDR